MGKKLLQPASRVFFLAFILVNFAQYKAIAQCPVNDPMPVVCEDIAGGGTALVDLNDFNDLIAGATNTFEWYDGNPAGSGTVFANVTNVLLPNINGVFVVVTEATGCSDFTEVTFTIASRPVPVISGEGLVCPGTPTTYSVADNGGTYSWSVPVAGTITEDNGNAIVVEWGIDSNGPHTISVTEISTDVCSGTASLDVTVEADGVLICNDLIQVSLDENCQAAIRPDMILEGDAQYPDDSYAISITDADGNTLPNNIVDATGAYTITIEHLCTGNTCWGVMNVEDKLDPVIECPPSPTLDFVCTDVGGIYQPVEVVLADGEILDTGNPTASDNCGEIIITYSDELAIGGICTDDVITRTFVVTDGSGNTASCTQSITIRKPTIADATLPGQLELNCNDVIDVDPQTLYDAGYDGLPVVTTFYGTYPINQTYCNLGASYYDAPTVDICGGSYKVIRTWSVIDWCTAESTTRVQIIKVEDTDGPAYDCPVYEDVVANTTAGLCEATVTVLNVENFTDNCSGLGGISVELTSPDGSLSEHNVGDELVLAAGEYTFTYIVTDECGNEGLPCQTILNIIDNTPPVAICDEHTVVSINTDGFATVCWQTFDDGSYDNCSPVTIRVKRMDVPSNVDFAECVEFDCSDVGDVIMVRMRVYDLVSNDAFDDNDDDSRYNECMIEVTVQDKLDPVLVCPPDKELDCHAAYDEVPELVSDSNAGAPAFFNGQMAGFYPGATDNCSATVFITDSGELNNCGEGTITRTWTAEDDGGRVVSCEQLLIFTNMDPFNTADIEWPADADVDCASGLGTDPGDLPPGENYPVLTEDACDLVAVTYQDQLLTITEDACYKILRKWIVLDWCQIDESQIPLVDGYWEYTQIIKVSDTVAPTITSACEDIEVCNYQLNCGPSYVSLILTAEDDACAMGDDLNYSFTIDAFNDSIPDNGSLFNGDSNDASNSFPVGTHHIYWSVEDNCGNVSYCDYNFIVKDCKKPTPVLISGLATVVMPSSGTVTLWATDFDNANTGSFDNCTLSENLDFYVRIIDGTEPPVTNLAEVLALDNNVTFDCDHLGYTSIEVYVVDEAGNWDYANTYANIQDPNDICTPAAVLAGSLYTEFDEMVAEAEVNVQSGVLSFTPVMTTTDGHFEFEVPVNNNYTISPEKDIHHLNGVTTYDLVLISKHILGYELLDSPYKIIAADANRSNSVTTFDLVQVRRLILNIDTGFNNNTSWRFIDAAFAFPNPTNPFATSFPEIITINELAGPLTDNDFIGVKVGDVNNSAIPGNYTNVEGRNFDGSLNLYVEDMQLKAGKTYEIAIKAENFNEITGYQYTLNFDDKILQFNDIHAGQLAVDESNFGLTNLRDGVITTSWHNSKAITIDKQKELYTLNFTAKTDGLLSDALSISSNYTQAEAYNVIDEFLEVSLGFRSTNTATTFLMHTHTLHQNRPNPFKDYTVIAFELPEATQASIIFTDISGRMLKRIDDNFAKGYHEVRINESDLEASGVIYYKLQTGDFVQTRKMILLHK